MTFEEYVKEEREEARTEGRAEGRAEGRSEGELLNTISLVRKKYQKGKTVAEVADDLEEELSIIQPIYDCIKQNTVLTDDEILNKYREIIVLREN